MQACEDRHDLDSLEACAARCSGEDGCVSFNWAAIGEDPFYPDGTTCTLYDVVPDAEMMTQNGDQQLLCAVA